MLAIKKKAFTGAIIVIFVATNLLFIFLQIHKQSQFVRLSYDKQRLEKEHETLLKERNDFVHKLYLQQSRKHVKQYAKDKLGMRPTSVRQMHRSSS